MILDIGMTLSSCGSAVGTTTQRGFLNYPVLFLLHCVLCYKSCNGASFSPKKLVKVAINGHLWCVHFWGARLFTVRCHLTIPKRQLMVS